MVSGSGRRISIPWRRWTPKSKSPVSWMPEKKYSLALTLFTLSLKRVELCASNLVRGLSLASGQLAVCHDGITVS